MLGVKVLDYITSIDFGSITSGSLNRRLASYRQQKQKHHFQLLTYGSKVIQSQ